MTIEAPPATPPAVPITPTTPPVVPPTPTEWTASLNDEMKGYVQSKGFKAPQDVLESYKNFEKLHGVPQDRLLKLPEDLNTPEGNAVFERLGAPKEAKDYNITIPKEHGDEKFGEWLREVAFKNKLTNKQVEGIVTETNARNVATRAAMTAEMQATQTKAVADLKTKWGAAFEQNKNLMDQAAATMGWTDKHIGALAQALGHVEAAEMIVKIANATGEHPFVLGNQQNQNQILAPAAAKAELANLMNDKDFVAKWGRGDTDARKKVMSLNQMISPGTMTI